MEYQLSCFHMEVNKGEKACPPWILFLKRDMLIQAKQPLQEK